MEAVKARDTCAVLARFSQDISTSTRVLYLRLASTTSLPLAMIKINTFYHWKSFPIQIITAISTANDLIRQPAACSRGKAVLNSICKHENELHATK